jgi:hypothetical protein
MRIKNAVINVLQRMAQDVIAHAAEKIMVSELADTDYE